MAPWQTGTIEANGVTLFYTRSGGELPPVLLAHGFSDDGPCWTPIAKALAPDYDLIMVDARGHGRSESPREPFSTSVDMAADLAAVARALDLHRPAVLGHSMGAVTTLALAAANPELPSAILLEDPPPWWAAEQAAQADPNWHEQQRRRLEGLKALTHEQLIATQRGAAPRWAEAELPYWADAKLRFNLDLRLMKSGPPPSWPAALGKITCPALLITADPAQGALVNPAQAAELVALVPQLQVRHIADAGHNIRREQPARYIEIVRGFLAEHIPARS
jgi:pimeloyl-ACP methyl ester carboxylesterase